MTARPCLRRLLNVVVLALLSLASPIYGEDLHEYFHADGPLAGTLKSDRPLPLYDANPQHLWNRMYSAFYIRPRPLPATDGQPATTRFEGGDVIEFLACGKTEYWSGLDVFEKVNPLLDEFLQRGGEMSSVANWPSAFDDSRCQPPKWPSCPTPTRWPSNPGCLHRVMISWPSEIIFHRAC